MNVDGLITCESAFDVAETVERLVEAATDSGLTVFARIDHARGAADVGLELPPTVLVLVGNPRGGTALMQDRQTAAIDLPAKVLVWQDEEGRVRLGYNDAEWLRRRHGLSEKCADRVQSINAGLGDLARAATEA